ncbi:PTS galactitol transporter subunit IIA [Budvicia diplopodorum]|uniref:PTS galactitol transporter subunit IIA n=1 Tax=Budvicia diplopodorum TaxID=1119056 RepID=UPI00135C55C4|nr:PTS galactitol transporter subunit IIA [Budvicia diplopodorum]
MQQSKIFVRTGIKFADYQSALHHISETLVSAGVVKQSYLSALLEREAMYPTGIELEQHAVAIPHCEVTHANEPAIYLIRPDAPVSFNQADSDGMIEVKLIIALVVTHPDKQLALLRKLFGTLQDTALLNSLLTEPEDKLAELFSQSLTH